MLLLRLVSPAFVSKKTGCCVVEVMTVVIEPGRAAVPQLIWRGHRRLRPRRCCCCCGGCGCGCGAATALLLLCCCSSDGVVLGLPLSVSRGATAPCLNSKFDVASPLPACDMESVYAFSAIRSPQTQPKACPSASGLFLA